MSTYKNLHGTRVNVVSSNPSNPKEGEVWYNSTLGQLKGYVLGLGSFASGGTASTARSELMGNVGTQTSSLLAGAGTTNVEEYDGSSWTEVNNRSTSFSRVVNNGTQTAALGYGGYSPSPTPTAPARYVINTEEYDGTNWTNGGNFPNGIQTACGTGVQTASFQASGIFGPYTTAPSSGWQTTTNEYDGSSWSNGGAMPAGRDISSLAGIQTAAIMVGGRASGGAPNLNAVLYYDGSSWTSQPNYPASGHAIIGSGTQTAAMFAGGAVPSRTTNAFTWDGSAFAATGSMANARAYGLGGGTTTAAIVSAGSTPGGATGATEEYTEGGVEVKTLTTSS